MLSESEIESEADSVLAAFDHPPLPVDPFAIAYHERILLVPGEYDGCFESRIEYRRRPGGSRFCLFYGKESPPDRTRSRVRYSIAHELGHYYLPRHREYLLSGRWHNSRADFVPPGVDAAQHKDAEREANFFAASLLMPRGLFVREVGRLDGKICTLSELSVLADQVFETSLTATAVRYVEVDLEPCCVVVSQSGYAKFCLASNSMRRLGIGFFQVHTPIPSGSVTSRMLAAPASECQARDHGETDSGIWFTGRRSHRLWEECLVLGRTAMTLTLLTIDEGRPRRQ